MTRPSSHWSRWMWRALIIVPITILSLEPQLRFWIDRGSNWQGSYATFNADEFLYSGYLNALDQGRSRRNDPFTGRVDGAGSSFSETAFSIQFIPPFVISTIARTLHLSAATSFIILALIAGVLGSLSIFWLILSITSDERFAATSALFVLVLGTLIAGQGLIGVLLKLDVIALGLPFLRRYQPAASFFLFFVFCTLVWHAFNSLKNRRALLGSLAAGLVLTVLVFSYLYLWTAAIAWLGCLFLLSLFQRREYRKRDFKALAIICAFLVLALVPYFYVVSHRSASLDELQTLISIRKPDLFRLSEIVGLLVLIGLVMAVIRGKIRRDDPRTLFAASFLLLPLVVFNQQVLTGRSMQPFHFEVFIINYTTLVGLVIVISLLWRTVTSRSLIWIAIFCALLGAVEVELTRAFAVGDLKKDEMVPAMRLLAERAPRDGSANDRVFSPHFEFMQMLPTWAPQATLLAVGSVDFGSATHDERKEFLFTHLYYSGSSDDRLRELLHGVRAELAWSYYVKYVVFGHERVRKALTLHYKPVTEPEIEMEVKSYSLFVNSFSRSEAGKYPLRYIVVAANSNFDFSRLDRWYERGPAEPVGSYDLYSLKLRE